VLADLLRTYYGLNGKYPLLEASFHRGYSRIGFVENANYVIWEYFLAYIIRYHPL
jgi:hypothetical protein